MPNTRFTNEPDEELTEEELAAKVAAEAAELAAREAAGEGSDNDTEDSAEESDTDAEETPAEDSENGDEDTPGEDSENANLQAEVEPSEDTESGDEEAPSEAPAEPVEGEGNAEEAPEESEAGEPGNNDSEGDTFPREYVQKLRDENAKYRQRAQTADALAERLHLALVEATGRLADPTDLPYSDEYLEDPEKLAQAIDKLLLGKPHLASRRPRGDIGQGATRTTAPVDLLGILRQNAR